MIFQTSTTMKKSQQNFLWKLVVDHLQRYIQSAEFFATCFSSSNIPGKAKIFKTFGKCVDSSQEANKRVKC